MSMAVRTGYINPLTMMKQNKNTLTGTSPLARQKIEKKEEVKDLQVRQQAVQNNILLLKSSTDGAVGSEKTQEILQEKLEEISSELKTAKAQESRAVTPLYIKERFDRYNKENQQTSLSGLYEIQKAKSANNKILVSPFAEQK